MFVVVAPPGASRAEASVVSDVVEYCWECLESVDLSQEFQWVKKGHRICPWGLGTRKEGCPCRNADTHLVFQIQTILVVIDVVRDG